MRRLLRVLLGFFLLCSQCFAGQPEGDAESESVVKGRVLYEVEFRTDKTGKIFFDVEEGDEVSVGQSLFGVRGKALSEYWQLSPYKAQITEIVRPHESLIIEGQLVLRLTLL